MSLLSTSGAFATWDNVGDSVVGTITGFGIAESTKFDNGAALAVNVETDEGDEVTVAVRIRDLKKKLADVLTNLSGDGSDPAHYTAHVGDRLAIQFTAEEKLENGNRAKLFAVELKPSETVAAEKPAGSLL